MLRSSHAFAPSVARRRLFSQASSVRPRHAAQTRSALLAASAAVAAGSVWYATRDVLHNDAAADAKDVAPKSGVVSGVSPADGSLSTLVWGSNKNRTLSPDAEATESIRTPAVADWLRDVALRDLSIHDRHAACIDANGDVYQWGEGFFGAAGSASTSGKPVLTLRAKNIARVQTTPDRVFCLSTSGHIYALSSRQADQQLAPGQPTPASTPWWGTGWLWGEEENVDFAQIAPSEKLGRGERFVSISAGRDHLLALTNNGRTFAHPINLKANDYGQLGLRRVDVPNLSAAAAAHARTQLELTPRSVADPYARSTPAVRRTPEASPATPAVDDSSIRFSDRLFELPALKGVQVGQIATGARTSFARTTQGRVLGWGANEFGQIGLGGNVTIEAITVPTEVVLWRSTPATMRTTCLDVSAGGDLTFFTVERSDGAARPFIDVLACGNGQFGGLGNAQYSNGQGTPVRTKNVSGLLEYSEDTHTMRAIHPHAVAVAPTGHVLLTLDTLREGGPGGAGRDLLVWGANQDFQLGNGKRGSLAAPWALHAPNGERVILGTRRADVKSLQGKLWRRGVLVEQCAVAGWGNSVVYWRISSVN
ncbi:hypothetical protein PHLGIDRAFT_23026 [Phlebiopsis gigantea 11061_1 CR5-6]|uniref:Uncharacterized protein n=1 Tax=Phlebiopsis gigantea (strain 11061_1 CR5-6) TaxID=745531 RepID=A0A0C3SAK3_PHLG1|nr:hypothetical protein PHLGIDRAFT_23026 [Phlebiopsis gigantea 11061_1 CR5-6]